MHGHFSEIPVVDLAAWRGTRNRRDALAAEVREICHHVGFFVVVNHGVDNHFIDAVFAMMRKLFALPIDEKLKIDKRLSRHFRGWEAEGAEYTNGRPDIREQVDLWSEHPSLSRDIEPNYLRLLGPNQWFSDAVLPEFRPLLEQWFLRMGDLAKDIMGLFAAGLGQPLDLFEQLFGEQRMSLTKLIHYPPTPSGQAGVNAHHDAGFLTILAPGETAGLQVENASGQWIPVEAPAGSFVINLGEMLQGMTANYFVATPHRVITTAERYSAGYFHGPALDTPLDPIALGQNYLDAVAASPRHAGAGFMARAEETAAGVGDMRSDHKPETYGEQLWNYFSRSYPDNMQRHYPSP